MSDPLVSIISPTYNHEKFIADCIRSVQAQTYPQWEMIIVDDGSTDGVLTVANAFAEKDTRIRVFARPHVGIFRLGETYNFALAQANGKYVAVLEGDDVWLPEKLALQVAALESDADAVLSWGQAYSSTADLSEDYALHPTIDRGMAVFSNTPLYSASKDLLFTCFIPALTVMVRTSALHQVGGFLQDFGLPLVDLPTWQQLSLLGSFAYITRPLGRWRIYPEQITKTYTAHMAEGFYKRALMYYAENKAVFAGMGITESAIRRHYRKLLVMNYSRSGRYLLMRKNFRAARKDYCTSIFKFGFHNPLWKLRSAVGILFSLFHADIEGFAKRLGRVSYK